MSHEECLAKLKQAGFINVDKWSVAPANLLALCRVMANAPHTTELESVLAQREGGGGGELALRVRCSCFFPFGVHIFFSSLPSLSAA